MTTVEQLKRLDAKDLYDRLCEVTGVRHDPCCEDVFRAAVEQAKDPKLPLEKTKWSYWSKVRKSALSSHGDKD